MMVPRSGGLKPQIHWARRGLRSSMPPLMSAPRSRRGAVVLPSTLPRPEHQIGVVGLAQGAVVAPECPEIVPSLHVEIVPQNGAAVSEVCPEMEQVVVGLAEQLHPERHDLHVAACARAGHGVLAKAAFHLDQPEDKLRIEPRPHRLIVDRTQQLHAALSVGHAWRQALFHLVDPALAILGRAKMQPGWRAVRHHGRETLTHAVGERLVGLISRDDPQWEQRGRESSQPPHEDFRKSTTSLRGTSRGLASRLPLYSALPAASPRSESTRRCGMPMRSMSAKSTPGRSSRSSIRTSMPAAPSASWRRPAAARTSALLWKPIGTRATAKGAIGAGNTIPRSSWFCSMAAATTRVTPMP